MDFRSSLETDRAILEAGSTRGSAVTVGRCRVLLAAADGRSLEEISAEPGWPKNHVHLVFAGWRDLGPASLTPVATRLTRRLLRAIGELTVTIEDCGSAGASLAPLDDDGTRPGRSARTCEAPRGVCSRCSPQSGSGSTWRPIGDRIGRDAALGIGRALATGPLSGLGSGEGSPGRALDEDPAKRFSKKPGIARLIGLHQVLRSDGTRIASSYGSIFVEPFNLGELIREAIGPDMLMHLSLIRAEGDHRIPGGWILHVDEGERVSEGQLLASVEWTPVHSKRREDNPPFVVVSDIDGSVRFKDIHPGENLYEGHLGSYRGKLVLESRPGLVPRIELLDRGGEVHKTIQVPCRSRLLLEDGQPMQAGERLFETGMGIPIQRGLVARIFETLEARRPDGPATLASIDGVAELGKLRGTKRVVVVRDGDHTAEHSIPALRPLSVKDGGVVRAGGALTHGNTDPRDLLEFAGEEEATRHIVERLESALGAKESDATLRGHLEIVLREMFRWRKITDPGGSGYRLGQTVDRFEAARRKDRLLDEGKQPARYRPTLLGMTEIARLKHLIGET